MVAEKKSTEHLLVDAKTLTAGVQSALGQLMPVIAEIDRREGWRQSGATSMGAWLSQQCGISEQTGRMWAAMARKLWDVPQTAAAFEAGELSYDKVQAMLPTITPETDAAAVEEAKDCSVRELNDLAKARRGSDNIRPDQEHEGRYLRFNDALHTITARLASDTYAMVKNRIVKTAKAIPNDGVTSWDQRLADALCILAGATYDDNNGDAAQSKFGMSNSATNLVVAHTDLEFLKGGEGSAELERLGLIARETVERIACDARIVLAVDDELGHTMFEGRSHRYPTDTQRREVVRRDRHCRFPGCSHLMFADVHHIVHWVKGGLTDLPNLVLLCRHHHTLLHSKQWSMTGDSNQLLSFVGPSGQVMISRPSRLWDRPTIRPGRAPTS